MRVRICDDSLWAIYTNCWNVIVLPFRCGRQIHFHLWLLRWGRECVPFKFYNKYEIILVYDTKVTGTVRSAHGVRNSRHWVSKSKFNSVGCLHDNAKSEIESRCGWPVRNYTPSIDKTLFASCWASSFACCHRKTCNIRVPTCFDGGPIALGKYSGTWLKHVAVFESS